MYTTAPVLFRKCNKAFEIPDTKYVVEPGIRITIPTGCFHHDEKYFPNPLKFDPERFAEGNTAFQKSAYLPFGDGPRICIGTCHVPSGKSTTSASFSGLQA